MKSPARVEEHLVGVDVGVVVRDLDRVRVEVEQAGHERADDEAVARERLVHRRRLVDAPDDRLEVVDAERERVHAAVPADDVERVVACTWRVRPPRLRTSTGDVLAVARGAARSGPREVALGERRALERTGRDRSR